MKQYECYQLPCHTGVMNSKAIWQEIFQLQVLLQYKHKKIICNLTTRAATPKRIFGQYYL